MRSGPFPPKRSKYGNRKVAYQGRTFDSTLEYQRYLFLADAQGRGEIAGLEHQKPYPLVVAGETIATIEPDFTYRLPDGRPVVEDVKACTRAGKAGRTKVLMTRDWALKKKLFEAQYRLVIRIATQDTLTTLSEASGPGEAGERS